jgi:hypothetical protein
VFGKPANQSNSNLPVIEFFVIQRNEQRSNVLGLSQMLVKSFVKG